MGTQEPSVRITTGETVTVGGVPVTVEVDDGELVIRVGHCDPSAEGAPDLSPWLGRLHGNVTVRVAGKDPGGTQQHRFNLYGLEES